MIGKAIDSLVSVFSPMAGLQRKRARQLLRYQGSETNRLTGPNTPQNRSADREMFGPFGADSMRAWARKLVRDNAWAFSALESIVSETIGVGIGVQSAFETPEGDDVEAINEARDSVWADWCDVCEINGQMTFNELQSLAFREMVEAGECLVHIVTVPLVYRGIRRPVPLALELIEADRLATDRDTYAYTKRGDNNRIVRGVEIDELGKPVAYWIYPDHPTDPVSINRQAVRIEAKNILHLYRKDRIGQTRGISWFAPVVSWLRDLGYYVDNELQASAVASCYVGAIKTHNPINDPLAPPEGGSTTDSDGNRYSYMQPGQFYYLQPGEDVTFGSPGRPNSASEPWIALMLRGIAAGTGTSYESVSKDFSNTSYSSSRTSKLENRPRYRRWQNYWISHLCRPVWERFCEAASIAGLSSFPTMTELLTDNRKSAPAEFMPPVWEWVDVNAEQKSSEASIAALQSTYADEIGKRGGSWRRNFYQRAKEERLKKQLQLSTPSDAAAQTAQPAPEGTAGGVENPGAVTGELAALSTQQFNRNTKAIDKVLAQLKAAEITEAKARVLLSGIGLKPESIDALIADAKDGLVEQSTVDDAAKAIAGECDCQRSIKRDGDCGTGAGGFKPGNDCAGEGGGSESSGKASPKVKAWAEKKFKDPAKAEAFAKWFGDSKVVDENGEPLVVYHGTSSAFDEFSPSEKGMLGAGIYASAKKDDYGAYSAYAKKDGANVMPLYASLKNPHIATAGDPSTFDSKSENDGTIMIDKRSKKVLWVVVKDKTSVKSATGNRGTFDPKDPSIKKAAEVGIERASQ